jgi:transcriptional regulator with XRE-family HTH domain
METSRADSGLAADFARLSPRSKFAKEFRKLQLEHLLASSILDSDRFAGAAEMAKELGVTPRTVRNYLRERRLALFGPDRVTVHWYADEAFTNQTAVEVLTMDEYAQKLGISTRELRRRIWMERRDRIAKLRAKYKP